MSTSTPLPRRSARVILLSPDRKVLLVRFRVRRSSGETVFWATPGGGVEPGESDLAAARRELMEELALDVPLDGPVHTVANEFEHNGVVVANVDVFFLGRCDRDAPRLVPTAKEERDAMQQVKWWAVEEISSAADAIFPEDLDSMVRRLV